MLGRIIGVLALLFVLCDSQDADGVTAELKDQSQCNNRILASKGIPEIPKGTKITMGDGSTIKLDRATNFYRPKGQAVVVFPRDQTSIESLDGPGAPIKIPGCFRLKAKGIRVNTPLTMMTAEVDLRIGGFPDATSRVSDWPKPLPCQQQNINNTCPCGITSSCFFCDFCKNFKPYVSDIGGTGKQGDVNTPPPPSSKITRTSKNIDGSNAPPTNDPQSCACNIQPGIYDIDVKVCTPSGDTLTKILPAGILAQVEQNRAKAAAGASNTEFTLYAIISLYSDSFIDFKVKNDQTNFNKLPAAKQEAAWTDQRGKFLIGCHFVVADIII